MVEWDDLVGGIIEVGTTYIDLNGNFWLRSGIGNMAYFIPKKKDRYKRRALGVLGFLGL